MSYKITIKQAYTLFLLAVFSPLIRLAASAGAALAGNAVWLSAVAACAAYYGFILILGIYFRRAPSGDLYSLYTSAFGKIASRLIIFLYALWTFILAGFYLAAFAQRFAGMLMPGIDPAFFTLTLLALVYIILNGKLQSFTLMSEIFFYIVLLVMAALLALQLPKMSIHNLLPVTHYDAHGMVLGALPSIGVFAYFTPMCLLNSEIKPETMKDFNRYGLYSALVLLGMSLAIILMTAGIFGAELTGEMQRPFLMSVKTAGIMGGLERPESVFLLLWVVTDLAMIVLLMYVLMRSLGILTGSRAASHKTPLLAGICVLSLLFLQGDKLDELSLRFGTPVNLILGLVVPFTAVAFSRRTWYTIPD